MALLFLAALVLHTAVQVLGSNYGYVEWSDSDREDKNPAVSSKQNIHREPPHQPTHHSLLTTERTLVAHKIEEDLPRVVTAFLHSGDSLALRHVSCSKRYELSSLKGGPQVASHYSLHSILDTLVHATNFLNMLLQANRFGMQTIHLDIHWYNALVQSILVGDSKIHRAVVTFHTDAPAPGSHVSLQAIRTANEEVVLQHLSGKEHPHLRAKSPESDWVQEFKKERRHQVNRKVGSKSENYLLNKNQIKWSAPYLECENGVFLPYWLLTLTAGFYGLKNDSALEFRGIVRVDVNLQGEDIDQCSTNGWFAGTHRCNLTSMECTPIAGHGFVLDKYKCQCRKGFYHPHRMALDGFKSEELGSHRDEGSSKCLPCRKGCTHCLDDTPCMVLEDGALRLPLASLQALCIVIDLALMVVVYYFRSNKSIRTSGLILLEAIMFGALLLYFPVMIYYFHPSVFRCILLRWLRLLGFTIMYGTVILKLYRVLKVFLSRTAQRTPYMTSWRVIRLLAVILLVVLWFLVAWTLAVCQNHELSRALITTGLTPESLQFSICLLDRWDYMMSVAEFLFLLWGVYLCYAVRTVPTAFNEPRYLAVAIYNELLISAIFHIIRFSLVPDLHPDWMLMLFFGHTHLTVTVTLALLLIPKFLSNGTQARDDVAIEVYEEEFDMGRSGSYLNNCTTSAWSEHSVDPEDIRDELKKLYSQLEVYKCKKMLANNPHIQKKRSSKKGLGRTLMKRITEFPEAMHRQSSREDSIEHDSNRSTLKRNLPELNQHGKSLDESLKNKVMGLKRSFSYDHVCDQDGETASQSGSLPEEKCTPVGVNGEGSLLGSLIGRRHTKKALEPSVVTPSKLNPAESTESVPLFWKSASAHNLMHEKKTVHLRTSIMQKSLSVITSAKEKMPGLSNKTHSVEDASKKGLTTQRGRMLSGVDETPEHFPKMIVSQSVEYSKTPLKIGIMKQQVSGSQPSICSEMGRNLYNVSEVGTWETEEEETPVDLKTHKHISIALAETTGNRRGSGSSSSSITKFGRSHQRQKPGQSPSNRRRSKDKGGENYGGLKGQKSGPLRSPLPQKPDLTTFEFDEQPMMVPESDSISPDRIRRKKSVTPTDGKPKGLHSDHSKSTGSLLQPPSLMLEICPWDYTSPPSSEQEICTRPAGHKKKRKGSCSSNHRAEKDKGKEKSRERRSSSSKPSSERRRISQSSESGGTVSERRRSSTRDPELMEIRRMEVMLSSETEPKHSHPSQKPKPLLDRKKSSGSSGSKPAVNTETQRDVCPWDFEDSCDRA